MALLSTHRTIVPKTQNAPVDECCAALHVHLNGHQMAEYMHLMNSMVLAQHEGTLMRANTHENATRGM